MIHAEYNCSPFCPSPLSQGNSPARGKSDLYLKSKLLGFFASANIMSNTLDEEASTLCRENSDILAKVCFVPYLIKLCAVANCVPTGT